MARLSISADNGQRCSDGDSPLPGFTLLEVMISLAILSSLLVVIIQSNTEITFFLHRTERLSVAQRVVVNELQRIERENSPNLGSARGTFPKNHALAGNEWRRTVTNVNFLDVIPVTRIQYQVSWFAGRQKNTFEASILR